MKDEGRDLPILSNPPKIFDDLKPYWRAFGILKTSRNAGGMSGIGFIPHSEIISYLDEIRIHKQYERDEYMKWIQFIDREDIKISMERQKNTTQKKPPATPGRRK